MPHRQLALWFWCSGESSGWKRTCVRIIRVIHDSPQGVGVPVSLPSPESCLIFSPQLLPRQKERMWRCLCGWEPRKCSLEGRERKHIYIEGAFIELLSTDASKSLIHFKKKCGRFSLPCRECFFLISHVVRGVSVIFLSWCCRHSESPLEKSFGLPKAIMDIAPGFLCILYSQSRTYL